MLALHQRRCLHPWPFCTISNEKYRFLIEQCYHVRLLSIKAFRLLANPKFVADASQFCCHIANVVGIPPHTPGVSLQPDQREPLATPAAQLTPDRLPIRRRYKHPLARARAPSPGRYHPASSVMWHAGKGFGYRSGYNNNKKKLNNRHTQTYIIS